MVAVGLQYKACLVLLEHAFQVERELVAAAMILPIEIMQRTDGSVRLVQNMEGLEAPSFLKVVLGDMGIVVVAQVVEEGALVEETLC
eukprot:gene21803-26229_t